MAVKKAIVNYAGKQKELAVADSLELANATISKGIATSGSTPSIAAGAAAGTSPTISVIGNDIAGVVTVTTGTGTGSAGGIIATITFSQTLANTPKHIIITQQNLNAILKPGYISQSLDYSTTTLIIRNSVTLTASTQYIFGYLVIQ